MKQEAIVKKTATEITSDIRPPGGDGPSLTETIFESNDFRGATPGVWATGRDDDGKPDRGRALQSTQWHSVSSERMHELPHLGLCLNNEQLVADNLIRKPGASNLDWLDELVV